MQHVREDPVANSDSCLSWQGKTGTGSSWTACQGGWRRLLQGRVPPLSTEILVNRKIWKITGFSNFLHFFCIFLYDRPVSRLLAVDKAFAVKESEQHLFGPACMDLSLFPGCHWEVWGPILQTSSQDPNPHEAQREWLRWTSHGL